MSGMLSKHAAGRTSRFGPTGDLVTDVAAIVLALCGPGAVPLAPHFAHAAHKYHVKPVVVIVLVLVILYAFGVFTVFATRKPRPSGRGGSVASVWVAFLT